MEELAAWLAQRLGIHDAKIRRNIRLHRQAVADLVIETAAKVFLIEVKAGVPRLDDVARLSFLRHVAKQLEGVDIGRREVVPVLVAASVPGFIRQLAQNAKVETFEAPLEFLPPSNIVPRGITTQSAWRVCTALLRLGHFPGVQILSKAAGTSIGWTSTVVQQLRQRGIIGAKGDLTSNALGLLLDQVASERPMGRLEAERIPTGIKSWTDLMSTMGTQWTRLAASAPRPGIWVCGLTAASARSGYSDRSDEIQVYAKDPANVKQVFSGRKGGIDLVVYRIDNRDVASTSSVIDGLPTVSAEQALLDVAGFGYSARDIAIKLAEVLRV